MGRKIGRNATCPCGSGKKYKKCCGKKPPSVGIATEPPTDLQRKLMNGELPFRAEVVSGDSQPTSMKVYNAKVVKDGIETTLFEDEITLSTNSAEGDTTKNSSASFIVPVSGGRTPEISIKGNAGVSNEQPYHTIAIKDDRKQLKIRSDTGLFAVIRIANQRNSGFQYYDVLFGQKGQSEHRNDRGGKMRPHIAFYPTGNGKFVRLSGFACKLESQLGYDVEGKAIFPSSIRIILSEYSETISLSFVYDRENHLVVLTRATFK